MFKENDILVKVTSKRKVLGLCGHIVFVSVIDDFEVAACDFWTKKELEEDGWKLEEKEWEPEMGKRYWFITEDEDFISSTWENDETDKLRKNFLGIYPTKEAAEKALEIIKDKLK